jgi:hypothetical protein
LPAKTIFLRSKSVQRIEGSSVKSFFNQSAFHVRLLIFGHVPSVIWSRQKARQYKNSKGYVQDGLNRHFIACIQANPTK